MALRELKRRRLAMASAACGAVVLLGAAARADVINVPGDQPTIQAGVDAAVTGDEVVVAPGTYNELIDLLGKAITVRSSGGPDVTTIDGTSLGGSVITCASGEENDTVIQGFTITGGTGTNNGGLVGGGLFVSQSNPRVVDCTFADMTTARGAAVFLNGQSGSTTVLEHCRFLNNAATVTSGSGGGAISGGNTNLKVLNSVFQGNTSQFRGGAIWFATGSLDLVHCVFTDQVSLDFGGVLYYTGTSATLNGCIAWENGFTPSFSGSTSSIAASYSLANIAGVGILFEDPQWVDAAGGDFHLLPTSPCINAGDPAGVPDITEDLDGEARVQQCRPDMGVDETNLFFNDCNTNGEADSCDIAAGTSFDCDGTLVPDECEIDCNGNGLSDSCDLAAGTSRDFNDNNIPDECEPDCNENGLPDFIDAAFGLCDDDNGNGLCDECDGCGADIVDNAAVDINDLLALLAAWGMCPGCPEDLNGDGLVDILDLLLLLAEWGPCFADEADCTVFENCQLPSQLQAAVSDGDNGMVADNFVPGPSTTAITGLCWWGSYLDLMTFAECGPAADDFEVRYYADDGAGLPGALLASYRQSAGTLDATIPISTGNVLAFSGLPEFRWQGTHEAFAVTSGQCVWIEIVNHGSIANCSWVWEIGLFGDGLLALSEFGGPYQSFPADVAFCINEELVTFAPCTGLPAASPVPAPSTADR